MFWYVIILCLMVFPMTLAVIGYSRRLNLNKVLLPFCSIILLFFMAFRSPTVGADTKQYIYVFKQLSNIRLLDLLKNNRGGYELSFEYGYRLYNKLISYIGNSDQVITIANSILIIFLLSALIKKKSLYPLLSIWLYITLGIFQTQMNMSRNAIGILICYLSFDFIRERKLVKYILCVVLATLFHSSSILFLPFYWIAGKIKLTPKFLSRTLILAIVFGFGFSVIRPMVVRVLPLEYSRYFSGNTTKLESLMVGAFHLLLLLFTWVMMEREGRLKAVNDEIIGVWMFVAEIFFFCVGFDVAYATRMAALFGPYLIILIPNLLGKGIKTDSKRLAVIAMIVVICGIQYLLRLNMNNIGSTMPYMFFWS